MFSTLMPLEDEIESANLNFLEYYVPDYKHYHAITGH